MARSTPHQKPTLTERVDEMQNNLDEVEKIRERDVATLRDSIANNTKGIADLAKIVAEIAKNINGFSMESFSETLDKLVLLIDGDDSRDVTGLRKRMRDVEQIQAEQNKSLARIEKKLTNLSVLVVVVSIVVSLINGSGSIDLISLLIKLFAGQ